MIKTEIAIDSEHGWNQKFVSEGIKVWDREGYGCFAVFIQAYVIKKWVEMVRLN